MGQPAGGAGASVCRWHARSRSTATSARPRARSVPPAPGGRRRWIRCCRWPRPSSKRCSAHSRRCAPPCGSRWRFGATGWNGRGDWPARSKRSASTSSRATAAPPRGWRPRPSTPACRRPPPRSGAFGFLLQLVGHSHGWPFPRGGMQSLADALIRRARREGAAHPLRRDRREAADPWRAGGRRAARRRRADRERRGRQHGQRRAARADAALRGALAAPAAPLADLALRHRAVQARLRPLRAGPVGRRGTARGRGRACRR